jgi:transcriptional regulator with XRE-family HTH domain
MRYNMKESGKRIQELRRDRGMTQTQLAEYVGISSDNLGRIERGQQGVSIDLLIELADFFAVSMDYIALGRKMKVDVVRSMIRSAIDTLVKLERSL